MAQGKNGKQLVLISRCMLLADFEDSTICSRIIDMVKGYAMIQLMCDAVCYPKGMDAGEPVINIDGKEIRASKRRPDADEYDTWYNQRTAVDCTMKAVKVYLEDEFEIIGIIGSNLSPKCGRGGEEGDCPFVDTVREQLKEEEIDIPVIDVQCEDDLDKVRRLFE